jgi:hypothetical protein
MGEAKSTRTAPGLKLELQKCPLQQPPGPHCSSCYPTSPCTSDLLAVTSPLHLWFKASLGPLNLEASSSASLKPKCAMF